jgi:fatty-acyl-CoA synthase
MYMYFDKDQRTVGGAIRFAANKWPDKVAIYWKDEKITYQQLDEMSEDFAKGLVAKGIQLGDRVGLWMHNHPNWVVAWFGIAKIGGITVPLDYWYKPSEVEFILEHSGARALVTSEPMINVDFLEIIREIRPRLRGLDHVIVHGRTNRSWQTSWDELIEISKNVDDLEMVNIYEQIHNHDINFILYTSGTTGRPKGVSLSHYNMVRNAWDVSGILKMTTEDNILVPVPYSHAFGNSLALTLAALRGAAQTPMLQYDPKKALEMIDKYKVTIHHGVPTMFIRELEVFRKGKYSLKTLRTGIMAGAPCPIEVVKGVLDEMKCNILIAYGLTEASPVITMTQIGDSPEIMATTVGKPLPGVDVRVVDPETHRILQVGEQGEIVCKGYLVMEGGYFKQPDQTEKVMKYGWLLTGDLGEVDEFGYYKITGRAKDMVIVGGYNVFPRIIEEYIITHPKVQEVAAAGVPDDDLGEVVAVALVPEKGAEIDPQEIVDFCYNKITSATVPRYVLITDELPYTGRGKVQKFKLKEQILDLINAGELKKIVPSKAKKK